MRTISSLSPENLFRKADVPYEMLPVSIAMARFKAAFFQPHCQKAMEF